MAQQSEDLIVSTPSGLLRGSLEISCQDEAYCAFKGIPYAKPPLGPLRFRDPEPIEPWNGVRDATRFGPVCAQHDVGVAIAEPILNPAKCQVSEQIESKNEETVIGSEDCLYANVYTRTLDANRLKPVMVWVHGGAFIFSSGDDSFYGPDFLISRDIVLVTFNYRLGVLGFFNLEDEVAPGNQGFKDQVMLLKWVQIHISSFGGDPDNVTIFGGSSGAHCVHYLAVSPLAQGLFHKAIIQSGCLLNLSAEVPEPRKTAFEFLDILGYNKERNSEAIVEYLRTVSFTELIEAQAKLVSPQKWLQTIFPFGPGVDNKSSNPFMPESRLKAAERGIQVPLIIGYNSSEGIFAMNFIRNIDIKDLNENFHKYMPPQIVEFTRLYGVTIEDLKRMYLNKEDVSEKNLSKFLKLWGDITFIEGLHRTLTIQCRRSSAPTYFYKFSYDKNATIFINKYDVSIKGASHAEEISYLYHTKLCEKANMKQFQENTGADNIMKKMTELWTNFAKTGRPTITLSNSIPTYWQPVAGDEVFRYLNIDEDLRMEKVMNYREILMHKMNIYDE